MNRRLAIIAAVILVSFGLFWLGWHAGHAGSRIRYIKSITQMARQDEAGIQKTSLPVAETDDADWKPEEFISDLDESVHFTDQNILSWNFPRDWTYKDEIQSRGYLTFRPVKRTLPGIRFEDALIRMGQVKSATNWNAGRWIDFFCATCDVGNPKVTLRSTRVMTTKSGASATILYFTRNSKPCGALAYVSHEGFAHYYGLFGERIEPEYSDQSALGTFHRLVYRYEFSLMKDIIF